ncbi:MAG: hypothetical protein K2X87_08550 [Gemmataceae bacterium]|nr:hypothetical protein [Gemmataceae bacterium]
MANDVTATAKNRLKQRRGKDSLYVLVGPAGDLPKDKAVRIEQNGVPKAVWTGTVVDSVPRANNRVAAVVKVTYANDGPEPIEVKPKKSEDKDIRNIRCSITIDGRQVNTNADVDLYGDGEGD